VERVLHEWGMLQERKRREEALRESEKKYRLLIENTHDIIYTLNPEGAFTFVSPSWTELLGHPIDQVIGKSFGIFVHPDDVPRCQVAIQRMVETGERQSGIEYRVQHADGSWRWHASSGALVRNKAGKVVDYEGIASDITERKRAEEALRRAEENFRYTLDDFPLGVRIITAEGETIYANRAILDIYGYDGIEELRTTPVKNRYTPESYAEFQIRHNKRQQGEEAPSEYEISIVKKNGDVRHLQVFRKEVLWNGERQYQALYRDITERKRGEEALRESEEKHRMLFETMAQGVVYQDADGRIISANPAAERILGLSLDQMRGRTSIDPRWRAIHEDGSDYPGETHPSMIALRTGREVQGIMAVFNPQKESYAWINISAVPQFRPGGSQPYQVYTTFADITERKQAEEVIRTSLREKEVLLREIHHRVKNNMQVISSLFNLQAGYIKDEEALRILKEGQTRIRSMALVHEKLYQSGDLSRIDLAGYIQSLSAHLFHVYLVDPNQVRLETEFEDVPLDINTALPCGLILNELISNALKHAFPAGRKGVLMIRLRRGKDGAVELRIADNGVGFPKGLDFRRIESLGLQIVNLLVGQLEGTIKLAGKNGTAFTVAFREMKQELGIGADRGHE